MLIAGLHGPSEERMRREFGKALDLRFYDDESSVVTLHAKCAKVDAIIAMTKFISHKHSDVMKLSDAPYIEISGGLTKLRTELTRQAAL